MSECQRKLDDKKFQFWLKSILATAITKEGIDETVKDGIEKVQKEILAKIPNNGVCSQCSIEEIIFCKTSHVCVINIFNKRCSFHNGKVVRKCPNDVCDTFRDEIKGRHKTNRPSWKITKAKQWCSDPFEVAKCYLPPAGYDKCTCIEEVDLNGVLSIILNQKNILAQFDENKCKKARKITNTVRHSPSLEIEEKQMNKNLDIFIQLLGCSQNSKALEAQQKIVQLKSDLLSISTDYMAKVLEDVISGNNQKSTTHILEVTRKAVAEVHNIKAESISKILEVAKGEITSIIYQRVRTPSDPASGQQIEYDQLKEWFKEDLVTLNKDHHGTIAVSPLFDKTDIPLQEVYVNPDIRIGEFPQTTFDGSQHNVNLLSLKRVFEGHRNKCREIYVSSKAGLGKTVFCKRLALIWCMAHDTEQSEQVPEATEEEIDKLKEFDFLFCILLRDVSSNDCEVDAMIQHQIIDSMSRSRLYTKDFLQHLLHHESCLIIIDGLDEWIHPKTCVPVCHKKNDGMPHRISRKNCTYIITSRPWKFRDIKLKTCHHVQHLEIIGLSKQASDELIKRVIQKLNTKTMNEAQIVVDVEKFNDIIRKRKVNDLKSDPLVLMYLACLWCGDRTHFGDSRCDIYSSLVDLLLERAEKRNNHIHLLSNNVKDIIILPQCLHQFKHCRKYSKFLVAIGKLAFQKFFTHPREYSLVFGTSSAELEDILSPLEAMFAKEAGFLTASKYGPRESRYSFYHKTLQEFFVALYLHHSREFIPVLDLMNDVERIISNEKLLVFLCGLNPEVASNLSAKLCHKVSSFEDVQGYRCDMGSWNYFVGYNKTMKTYQDMHIACYKEYKDTFHFRNEHKSLLIYQEDIFIDEDFRDEDYSNLLKIIFEVNGPNIKSVKIRDVRTEAEFQDRVKLLKQKQLSHLEKLDLKCQIHEKDLCELLESSKETLKCFVIKGGEWQNDKWTHNRIAFSDNLFKSVQNMENLSELYLRTMTISHNQLNGMIDFVSNRENMKKIGLTFITCKDHGDSCSGMAFNLARHKHLEMLELGEIPLESVDINTESLEVCYVGNFPNRDIMLKIFHLLCSAPNLQVIVCGFLDKSEDINDMLRVLVELQTVKTIWLVGIDLRKHCIPARENLEHLHSLLMIKVQMDIETFRSIVNLAIEVKNTVRVGLFDSEVNEKQDFEISKKDPDFLQKCEVLLDEYYDIDHSEFLFKTMKERRISEIC